MPENIAWSFLDLLWHVQQPVFCSSKLVKLFGGQLRSLSTTSGWVCCQRPKYVSLSSFLMSRLHNHYVITGRLLQFNDGIIKESCLFHVFLNVTITHAHDNPQFHLICTVLILYFVTRIHEGKSPCLLQQSSIHHDLKRFVGVFS